MAKKLTQHDLIAIYLHDVGSITPFEAFNEFGITKLATRISEMKRMGYKFDTAFESKTNRFGTKSTFARYSFSKENQKV